MLASVGAEPEPPSRLSNGNEEETTLNSVGDAIEVRTRISDEEVRDFDTIKTFKCFVCRSARAKYRCPGCSTPTCSLPCVKKHKALLECDGIRNKVKFRRLEQFTNLDILSDYRLLEEITREKESKKRNFQFRFRPSRKMKLKENVRVHSDVIVHLLPPHFVRAKENDSWWDVKHKSAKWRIGWDFEGTILHTSPIKDSAILYTALLQATSMMSKEKKRAWNKLISSDLVKVTLIQEKGPSSEMNRNVREVTENAAAGSTAISAKSERWPASLKTTIASNLRGSTFIEFPTFKVDQLGADDEIRAEAEADLLVTAEEREIKVEVREEDVISGNDSSTSSEEDDDDEEEAKDKDDDEENESDEEMDNDEAPGVGESDSLSAIKIEPDFDDETSACDGGDPENRSHEGAEVEYLKDGPDNSNDSVDL